MKMSSLYLQKEGEWKLFWKTQSEQDQEFVGKMWSKCGLCLLDFIPMHLADRLSYFWYIIVQEPLQPSFLLFFFHVLTYTLLEVCINDLCNI